jgi:hypothetical protein
VAIPKIAPFQVTAKRENRAVPKAMVNHRDTEGTESKTGEGNKEAMIHRLTQIPRIRLRVSPSPPLTPAAHCVLPTDAV